MADNLSKAPAPSRAARQLEGYLMEQRETDQSQQPAQGENAALSGAYLPLLTGGPVVALLLVWRWRRSRRA